MRVDLARPLAPGESSTSVRVAVHRPRQGARAHGARRAAVRDRAVVSARWPCTTTCAAGTTSRTSARGEFYLEYGSFDVSLTVPASYIVAATGSSKPRAGAHRRRSAPGSRRRALLRHGRGDHHRGRRRARRRARGPRRTGRLTWRFTADSVRDFAFGGRARFSLGCERLQGHPGAHALSPVGAGVGGGQPDGAGRRSSTSASSGIRYPYPHATTVEGPVEGMEYPMITFVPQSPSARGRSSGSLAHEFGHQWSPMIVGSNERLYPWMDEGFNTFIDLANAANYFAGTPYGDTHRGAPAAPLRRSRHARAGAAAHHAARPKCATCSGPAIRSRR